MNESVMKCDSAIPSAAEEKCWQTTNDWLFYKAKIAYVKQNTTEYRIKIASE